MPIENAIECNYKYGWDYCREQYCPWASVQYGLIIPNSAPLLWPVGGSHPNSHTAEYTRAGIKPSLLQGDGEDFQEGVQKYFYYFCPQRAHTHTGTIKHRVTFYILYILITWLIPNSLKFSNAKLLDLSYSLYLFYQVGNSPIHFHII